MSKRALLSLAVLVIFTLLLSSCRLPASQAPAATATLSEEFPFPIVTTQPDVMKEIQTQTAVALQQGGAQATAEPGSDQTGGGQPGEGDDQAGGGGPAAEGGTGGEPNAEQAQPTQAPPAVSADSIATPTRPSSYTLQKGEWPICIARRYDLDIASFFAANNLTMASKPGVGTTLTIPSSGTWNSVYGARALRSHPTSYTIQSGDTINTVACQFGDVYPEVLAQYNGLSSPYTLTAGQTLQIP